MQVALLFIYNADSNISSRLVAWGHRILSPGTYPCRLSALTHGPFRMRSAWRRFILSLPVEMRFLHRDIFYQEYGITEILLPAAFLVQDGSVEPWLSAEEINRCTTLPELIVLVRRRLRQTIDEKGWKWLRMEEEQQVPSP